MADFKIAGGSKKSSERIAVGLLSGGLDSLLSHIIISDLGFKVIAIHYDIPFCTGAAQSSCLNIPENLGRNIEVRKYLAGDDFIELVKNPRFGYGKHLNMCIDCRLFMLKKAKDVMEEEGAEFVFTGEVLQQRPMSQRKDTLRLIDKNSGLDGYLLRPLSAKKFEPTIPEREGIVNREKLFDFHGRNRTPQMDLAKKLGLENYPTPAGGCRLTDENYARMLKEAFDHGEDSVFVINLLMIGRHFRSDDGVRIVCGRTGEENSALLDICDKKTGIVTVKGAKSTYSFIWGNISEENKRLAGRIAARYSKVRNEENVEIKWWTPEKTSDNCEVLTVKPFAGDELKKYKI